MLKRTLSWLGATAVAATACVFVSNTVAEAVADDSAGASLVEDYTHPGAENILQQYELKVFKGDGHIFFYERRSHEEGQCTVGQIQVEKLLEAAPWGYYYCFKTQGSSGFLTLEVPATFGVRGGSVPLEATAMLPTGEKTYKVAPNQGVAIDPGSDGQMPPAVLVELRLTPA